MPFPLVAHQGLAAPALLADRGRRLDGVAFLAGTLAPDLPYALDRSRLDFDALGHTPLGLVVWCVPVVVVAAWLFRRVVSRPLATHVPDVGSFRLRDVGLAATDHPALLVTVASGILGALTHLIADGITHPEQWAVDWFPVLTERAPVTLPDPGPTQWYDIVRVGADYGGALLLVVCLYLAGRMRVRQGRPRPVLPEPTVASWLALWGSVAAGGAVGMALAARVWGVETMAQGTMLFTWSMIAGTLLGCALANRFLT